MNAATLTFAPYLPLPVLLTMAVLAAAILAYGFYRRAKGSVWRLLFLALLLGALANPVLRREERDSLPDITLVMRDTSPSNRLDERAETRDAAAGALAQRLEAMPDMEVREIEVGGDQDGTPLFRRLQEALAEVDRSRVAAVLALTDGQAHDVPADDEALRIGAPVHVLLTGEPGERDRQLRVLEAPTFAMVDEEQRLVLEVRDLPSGSQEPVPVLLRIDGNPVRELLAIPGTRVPVPFVVQKAGETVVELEAQALADELTPLNNRAVLTVNGVRDRLRVLLVSGQPYPGLRVWRNLLKADPAVDLVHFTILRPPEKQDGTPIRELALIAFPSRELFEVKLEEFDLVIFDRYTRRGLLPLPYLENVARYVENGGALLEAAGPEFASPLSLFRTPLARVLPGRPSGEVFERGFKPMVTDLGRRHPVTAEFQAGDGDPEWGRWFRQIDVESADGQVLMTGVADRPLLLLNRVGEGRVAQLLSDHHWLWQRGFEGGGPQAALLRRLVHWLMKEPELEEEALRAASSRDGIAVEHRSLSTDPVTIEATSPTGEVRRLTLQPDEDGIARGRIESQGDGLWRISDGERTVYAAPRPVAEAELADMRAVVDKLAPLVEATSGSMTWLREQGVPDLRRVGEDRRTHGRGWIGLVRNEAYVVTGASETRLLPAWLALALLLGTALLAWWREGKA